jgi:hypothetical protein
VAQVCCGALVASQLHSEHLYPATAVTRRVRLIKIDEGDWLVDLGGTLSLARMWRMWVATGMETLTDSAGVDVAASGI